MNQLKKHIMERARKAMKVSDISVKGAALSLTIKNICLNLYKNEMNRALGHLCAHIG